jgi:predicted DNA binding CopG/RHH family protein
MNNPLQLDAEERELLNSYENDEWRSVGTTSDSLRQYQAYAVTALEAAGFINILLPQEDIGILRQKATEAGMSYQSLVAKILHQYITGHLVEKPHSA